MTPLFRRSSTDAAFERLYRRHVTDVYRYAYAVLGEQADAEDVTQTTFLNAYRAYTRGERPEKPQNWLITIAHNVCRQRFRQAKRRPEVALEHVETVVAPERDGPSAEELRRAFAQLPQNQREALVMRELEGRPYAEIATVMGISESALETLIFRARRSLREQLEEQLTCDEAAFALSQEADGRLSAAGKRALRAHVRACPECATAAQRDRAIRGALKGILAVPLPSSLASFFGGAAGSSVAVSAAGGVGLKALTVLAAGAVAAGSGTYAVKAHERHPAKPVHRTPALVAATPVAAATPAVLETHSIRTRGHAAPASHARHKPKGRTKRATHEAKVPPGRVEQTETTVEQPPSARPDVPPGRAKKTEASEPESHSARPSTPPGHAKKTRTTADATPPGQATKRERAADLSSTPPGQARKTDTTADQPQAGKADPPGQARKAETPANATDPGAHGGSSTAGPPDQPVVTTIVSTVENAAPIAPPALPAGKDKPAPADRGNGKR